MIRNEELETKGSLQRRLERHSYDRLIILSDGVFAIAITLAALEIKIPNAWRDFADLRAQATLPLLTYFVSFFVVASYWNSQRTLFARLVRVDAPLRVLALLQLAFVALIPVVTRVFYDHHKQPEALGPYCATLAVCGYLTTAAWGYVALRPTLAHAESETKDSWVQLLRSLPAPVLLTLVAATNGLSAIALVAFVALTLVGRLVQRRLVPSPNRKSDTSET